MVVSDSELDIESSGFGIHPSEMFATECQVIQRHLVGNRVDWLMETIRYVLPFLLYVLPAFFESADSQSPVYMSVCTLKGILAFAAIVIFRRSYPDFSAKGFVLAAVAGVVGFAVWIGLDQVQSAIPFLDDSIRYLQGERAGFNPLVDGSPSRLQLAFVGVRLIELIVVVPLVEEVFWRGYLSRYLISDEFAQVPQGTFTRSSFLIVALMFTSVHPEMLSAFVWGCMINMLYMRTMNLWSCVLMHSVTNGLLGAYILCTERWELW